MEASIRQLRGVRTAMPHFWGVKKSAGVKLKKLLPPRPKAAALHFSCWWDLNCCMPPCTRHVTVHICVCPDSYHIQYVVVTNREPGHMMQQQSMKPNSQSLWWTTLLQIKMLLRTNSYFRNMDALHVFKPAAQIYTVSPVCVKQLANYFLNYKRKIVNTGHQNVKTFYVWVHVNICAKFEESKHFWDIECTLFFVNQWVFLLWIERFSIGALFWRNIVIISLPGSPCVASCDPQT